MVLLQNNLAHGKTENFCDITSSKYTIVPVLTTSLFSCPCLIIKQVFIMRQSEFCECQDQGGAFTSNVAI
jgi:hypothetical protein